MAILVKLDSLREYARSLDERLRDINKYPESWVDAKINTAYEMVSTKRQPFLNEEVMDLKQYIIDGTAKFEVETDYDVTGWKHVFSTTPDPSGIRWTIKPDNKVIVDLDVNNLKSGEENLITFQYYYFPSTLTGDQYFSTDVYHMVRHAIASSVYDDLRDYEKRDNYANQLEVQARTVVNGLDYNADNVRKSNWGLL